MDPQVGTIVEGTVTSITKFGAFVALENRRSGLVHISEIANTFVNDVHDYLEEGQKVKVLVLSTEGGKINLSIKKALPNGEGGASPSGRDKPSAGAKNSGGENPSGGDRTAPGRSGTAASAGSSAVPRVGNSSHPRNFSRASTLPPSGDQSFEDKLKRFLSSSEGKMADLNRSMEGKRGGGRRRR